MAVKRAVAAAMSTLIAASGWAFASAREMAAAADFTAGEVPSVEVGLWSDPLQTAAAPAPPVWPTGPRRERSARSTFDRPDVLDGKQVHIVYLVAADMEDEKLDTNGVLQCSVRSWNEWFAEQSEGQSWRLDTFDPPGRRASLIDITYIQSSKPSSEIQNNTDVEEELIKAGLANPVDYGTKKFLSYVATDTGTGELRGR